MTAEEFSRRLSRDCALLPGSHVLVALSGGADSTALLRLFLQVEKTYPLSVSCAHVEHGIRGGAALDDLRFCRALCKKMQVPFYAASVDAPAYARTHGCGLEDAARRLRYDFLYRTAEETGADVIALAHHAQDQAETVLLHAARGSDVRGLCAMDFRRGRLIRPLLCEEPSMLRAYLESVLQDWREDASNADTDYARNRVRQRVLPELDAAVPGAAGALCRLARAARRDEDYFAAQISALRLPVIPLVDGAAVPLQAVRALHPALLSRVLARLIADAGIAPQSAKAIEGIMQAVREGGVVNLTEGAHAAAGKSCLCLTRAQAPQIDVPLAVPGMTDTPFGRFEVRQALPGETGDGRMSQRIPARILAGARVTGRCEGDVMIPFGRKMPVKLKKLMMDAGVERAMRNSVPVLRSNKEVLFAVGLRPAQCCRSTEDEEAMLVRFHGEWPRADGEPEYRED